MEPPEGGWDVSEWGRVYADSLDFYYDSQLANQV